MGINDRRGGASFSRFASRVGSYSTRSWSGRPNLDEGVDNTTPEREEREAVRDRRE